MQKLLSICLTLLFTALFFGICGCEEGLRRSVSYDVTFVDAEGTPIAQVSVLRGESVDPPEAPEKPGHRFIGWSEPLDAVQRDMTVEARYERLVHTVVFKDDQGDRIDEASVEHGGAVEAPQAPSREGYRFTGWSEATDVVEADMVVHATYERLKHTVVFVDGDDHVLSEQLVKHGEAAQAPQPPEIEGHVFSGWSKAFDDVKEDLHIVAHYDPLIVQIDFETYGGASVTPIIAPYGTPLQAPEPPVFEDHVFSGWYLEDTFTTPYTFTTMGAQDLTLHAKWLHRPSLFVRAEGDELYLGEEPFRFVSFNIPNLHILEDPHWHRVDPWEQEDALESISRMGGRVARIYTFSIVGGIRPGEGGDELAHIMGPGVYHEELFRDLDRALKLAGKHDIRLIIPFIDEWEWFGGIKEFAALYGKPKAAFFTDPEIKDAFKDFIAYVLTRENTYTGVQYKNEPAILAWELGNELRSAPDAWIAEMAAFVKSIDANHLLLSGRDKVTAHDLENDDIDIINVHYYRNNTTGTFAENAAADRAATAGLKPLIIGEYGLVAFDEIADLLEEAHTNGTSGSLIWSLRFRNVDGGFYYHDDFGELDTRSYHYPGFPQNDDYNERAVVDLLIHYAFLAQGLQRPHPEAPQAPWLFDVASGNALTWRGATGSYAFVVERSEDGGETWTVLAEAVYDAYEQGPFFIDESGEEGQTYLYRVKAFNDGGTSSSSNVVEHVYESPPSIDNLALFRPITASSEEDDGGTIHVAENANDGDFGTRWSSDYADGQWIEIDLEAPHVIGRVVLHWEAAYGRAYTVSVSLCGEVFETVAVKTSGSGGKETIVFDAVESRFLRLDLHERATQWGFSLYEIEVYAP